MEFRTLHLTFFVFLLSLSLSSCGPKPTTGEDAQITSLGRFEVKAQLLGFPGELVDKPLYDYAFVFKYKILEVYRGELSTDTIYVGHYNPLKPRDAVVDARVGDIGGNLQKFRVGDIHRIALEEPIDDFYMGGIINRYADEEPDPIYWAMWTNRVVD